MDQKNKNNFYNSESEFVNNVQKSPLEVGGTGNNAHNGNFQCVIKKTTKAKQKLIEQIIRKGQYRTHKEISNKLKEDYNIILNQSRISDYLVEIGASKQEGYYRLDEDAAPQSDKLEKLLNYTIYEKVESASSVRSKFYTFMVRTEKGFETSLAELIYSYFKDDRIIYYVQPTICGVLVCCRKLKDGKKVRDYIRSQMHYKKDVEDAYKNAFDSEDDDE